MVTERRWFWCWRPSPAGERPPAVCPTARAPIDILLPGPPLSIAMQIPARSVPRRSTPRRFVVPPRRRRVGVPGDPRMGTRALKSQVGKMAAPAERPRAPSVHYGICERVPWHGCPEQGRQPRAIGTYWCPRCPRNSERDRAAMAALGAGWIDDDADLGARNPRGCHGNDGSGFAGTAFGRTRGARPALGKRGS